MIIKDVISTKVYTSKLVGSYFCKVLNEMALSLKLISLSKTNCFHYNLDFDKNIIILNI